MCERGSVCVRERVCYTEIECGGCKCVSVTKRERERECVYICVCSKERGRNSEGMWI